MPLISRRDFLKMVSISSGALAATPLLSMDRFSSEPEQPNFLIFIFDAMSARNLSLYGYPRNTTPNLEKFAESATVYHSHHSAASFTTPGVASLLTGMLPWSHRAINQGGLAARDLQDKNLFHQIGATYHRAAFTQNLWAHFILMQFEHDLDTLLPPESFSLFDHMFGSRFGGDPGAYRGFDDFLFEDGVTPSSLVFGLAERFEFYRKIASAPRNNYSRGLPNVSTYPIYFRLSEVFDGLAATIKSLPRPYLAYFHLWAPHAPYKPSDAFYRMFNDRWQPVTKPNHNLGAQLSTVQLHKLRRRYDEYIANADAEFGRLLENLASRDLLKNTYIVVTSDHGEMLERGVEGHVTPLLYEPVIHIPLLISAPSQSVRRDVHYPTNSIDLLPSLLRVVGREVPGWSEGRFLPGFGIDEDEHRSLYMIDAKENPSFSKWKRATVVLQNGGHKLIYYTGYHDRDTFEFYDLEADFEELTDLVPARPAIMKSMQEELLDTYSARNKEYGYR